MHLKHILYCIISFFVTISLFANENTIEYYSQSQINVTQNIRVFEDTSKLLTINDIVLIDLDSINNYNKEILIIKFSESNYWIEIKLINKNPYIKGLILEVANPGIDSLQLFENHNGFIRTTRQTGDFTNFYTRQIDFRNYIYEILLEPDELYIFYFKINCGSDAAKIPINIYAQSSFTKKVQKENLIFGFYYGIILTVIVLLFIALIIKHKRLSIPFLIAYVFFIGAFLLNLDGLGFQFLYPSGNWWTNNLDIVAPILAIFCIHNFIYDYISLKYIRKKLFIYAQSINYSFLSILFLLVSNICSFKILIIITLAAGVATIILDSLILILSYRTAILETKVIISSFMCLLIVIVGFYLRIFTYYNTYYLEEILIKSGFIFQFVILSLALVLNFKKLQEKTREEAVGNLIKLNQLNEKSRSRLDTLLKEKTKSLFELNQKFKKAIIQNSNINTKLNQQKNEITKQKDRIIIQKNIIETRNRDITDSINYAERIQSSIFPSDDYIKTILPEFFVFYKPKEVIGGDLYWIEEFPTKSFKQLYGNDYKKQIIIAAIDCTGHGVPGALMSIVARDLLDKAINEKGLTIPSDILNSMHLGVIRTFRKDIESRNIYDGMDMALCTIDQESKLMQFAGAINPVWIIRDKVLTVIPADRNSIGNYTGEKIYQFKNNKFQLEKNDCVYLFSDGFTDQFGGSKMEKYKSKRFKSLLTEISHHTMQEQRKTIINKFNSWKGNLEQVDDVIVIGLKI